MKTKEELNALKNEVEALNKKLSELSEEELAQVFGGKFVPPVNGKPDIELPVNGKPDIELPVNGVGIPPCCGLHLW